MKVSSRAVGVFIKQRKTCEHKHFHTDEKDSESRQMNLNTGFSSRVKKDLQEAEIWSERFSNCTEHFFMKIPNPVGNESPN